MDKKTMIEFDTLFKSLKQTIAYHIECSKAKDFHLNSQVVLNFQQTLFKQIDCYCLMLNPNIDTNFKPQPQVWKQTRNTENKKQKKIIEKEQQHQKENQVSQNQKLEVIQTSSEKVNRNAQEIKRKIGARKSAPFSLNRSKRESEESIFIDLSESDELKENQTKNENNFLFKERQMNQEDTEAIKSYYLKNNSSLTLSEITNNLHKSLGINIKPIEQIVAYLEKKQTNFQQLSQSIANHKKVELISTENIQDEKKAVKINSMDYLIEDKNRKADAISSGRGGNNLDLLGDQVHFPQQQTQVENQEVNIFNNLTFRIDSSSNSSTQQATHQEKIFQDNEMNDEDTPQKFLNQNEQMEEEKINRSRKKEEQNEISQSSTTQELFIENKQAQDNVQSSNHVHQSTNILESHVPMISSSMKQIVNVLPKSLEAQEIESFRNTQEINFQQVREERTGSDLDDSDEIHIDDIFQ